MQSLPDNAPPTATTGPTTGAPPRVTMIVPVHDLADCLTGALDSLRAQSWRDFEALIIDDGSADGSGDLARAACAGDARFTVISQANQGLSGARNTGLDRARGDIIGFLDGDDRLHPEFLARMLAAMEGNKADWIACGVALCYPDGRQAVHSAIHASPVPPGDAPLHFDLRDPRAVVPHFPSAWNKLYRRDFIGDLRFDPGTWFEDHSFFWQLALRARKLTYLPQPLYLYSRDRPGQITGADDDRVFELFAVLDRVAGLIAAQDTPALSRHGQTALAMLASRLIHERLSVLRPGPRRGRFWARVRDWLARAGLDYTPGWDPGLCRATALVLCGHCPVSVVLWSDVDAPAPGDVAASLLALHQQTSPECEVFLPGDIDISAISETVSDHMTLIRLPRGAAARSPLAALRQVLDPAAGPDGVPSPAPDPGPPPTPLRGRYLILLRVGDVLAPDSLHRWITGMEAQGADLGVSGAEHGSWAAGWYRPPVLQPGAFGRDMQACGNDDAAGGDAAGGDAAGRDAAGRDTAGDHTGPGDTGPRGTGPRGTGPSDTGANDTGAGDRIAVPAGSMLALNPEPGARILRRSAAGRLIPALRAAPPLPPAFAGQALSLLLGHLAHIPLTRGPACPDTGAKNVSDMAENAGFTGAGLPVIRLAVFDFPGLAIPASPPQGGGIAALFRDAAQLTATLPAALPAEARAALPPGWQRLILARALQTRLYAAPGRAARAVLWLRIIMLCLWSGMRSGVRSGAGPGRPERGDAPPLPPDAPPPDSLPPDTLHADTLRADTLRADTGLSPRLARWLGLPVAP